MNSSARLGRAPWRALVLAPHVSMTGYQQDYVYNLAAAVRALAPEAYDSHLFALEVRLHILPLVPLRAAGTL